MAELMKDGPLFFPNILLDENFQKQGVVWGSESFGIIGLHWTVIDPRRHKMYIWEKDRKNFVHAAESLGASAYSNGPFLQYFGGNKYQATVGVILGSVKGIINYSKWKFSLPWWTPPRTEVDDLYAISAIIKANQEKYYTGHDPDGHIKGDREKISVVSRRPHLKHHHHFGRMQNRFFLDYIIGQGQAGGPSTDGFSEVIGGLFLSVGNYQVVDPQGSNIGAGHWGLAPLIINDQGSGIYDPVLEENGIEYALEQYHEKEKEFAEETPDGYNPPAEAAPQCTGLIIAAFYYGNVKKIANKLAGARVKDAVRVDGNASILLGHHNNSIVGNSMPISKRNYNKWGYQFQAE